MRKYTSENTKIVSVLDRNPTCDCLPRGDALSSWGRQGDLSSKCKPSLGSYF